MNTLVMKKNVSRKKQDVCLNDDSPEVCHSFNTDTSQNGTSYDIQIKNNFLFGIGMNLAYALVEVKIVPSASVVLLGNSTTRAGRILSLY